MTIGELEKQIRIIVLDTDEDKPRFMPTEVFYAIGEAMKQTRRFRSESRYVKGHLNDNLLVVDGNETGFEIPASTDAAIAAFRNAKANMEETWMDAIIFHSVHRLLLKDDPDTANAQLSDTYYKKFLTVVQG